jgi:hypothetical protein
MKEENNAMKENARMKNNEQNLWVKKKNNGSYKWRLAKLSNEDEVAHGRWTILHNDGIQNFGWNFNFRFKHNYVLKHN